MTINKLITSILTILLFNVGVTTKASAANVIQSGVSCEPILLGQALNGPLKWTHMRVKNESNTALWVTCSVTNMLDAAPGGSLNLNGGDISVVAWFGPDAANNADVFCVLREIIGAGTGTSGTIVTATVTPNSAARPTTGSSVLSNLSGAASSPITLTCELDPDTGLQGIFQFFN